VLILETMRYHEEVVPPERVEDLPRTSTSTRVNERELKAAEQLIESLETDFEPQQYHNEYYRAVMELVDRKARGEKIATQPPVERKTGKPTDLMAALEASLSQIRKETKKPAGRKKKPKS
jgi:DNA end-binding protein Ku